MFAPSNLIAIMMMQACKKPSVLLQQGFALPPQLLLRRCSLETPACVCVSLFVAPKKLGDTAFRFQLRSSVQILPYPTK